MWQALHIIMTLLGVAKSLGIAKGSNKNFTQRQYNKRRHDGYY
jgi:hypothetical protein